MSTISWLSFKACIERFSKDRKERLLEFLSPSGKNTLKALPPIEGDPSFGISSVEKYLTAIHYSWFEPLLAPFSEKDQLLLIAALKKEKCDKIKMHLKLGIEEFSLPSIAKRYVIKNLWSWMLKDQKEVLPLEMLPEDPLNPLIHLERNRLLKILDYLGLYDLSSELKKVISPIMLKQIHHVLKNDEIAFLKKITKEKDRLKTPSLGLEKWNGDEKKMRHMIQSRGINRLAKALFFSDKSLTWHLMHRLDLARAKVLQKYCIETHDTEAKEILIKQILNAIEETA